MIRGNFFGEFQEIYSTFPRHTNIRNDDVENLRFELALRGLHAVHHFNPVAFLAKGDLQQLPIDFSSSTTRIWAFLAPIP